MARVEGAKWDDLDVAADAIFTKKSATAGTLPRPSGALSSFDLDGSLDLVARLQKAAAEDAEPPPAVEPPPAEDDSPAPDDEDGGGEDAPSEKAAPADEDDGDQEKVAELASAAVLRQALSDVCCVLAGGEPELDKTAGVIVSGLSEGHRPDDLVVFLAGLEKQAFEMPFKKYMPWADLPSEGPLVNARRALWRTPEEKNLQAEARLSRAEAKAKNLADRQLLKDNTLYANRAAARTQADAAERLSQIRVLEADGLSRSQAEKILADKAAKSEKEFLRRAREMHGLDRNKVRFGLGNANFEVNKRVLTKTVPLLMGGLGAGMLIGRGFNRDDDRPRGITIS